VNLHCNDFFIICVAVSLWSFSSDPERLPTSENLFPPLMEHDMMTKGRIKYM
jgi:hypothetical protein